MARRWSSTEIGYGSVLGLIVVTYIVSVAFPSGQVAAVVVALQVVAVGIVFRASHAHRVVLRIVDVTLAGLLLAIVVAVVLQPAVAQDSRAELLIFYVSALLYGIAPFSIIRYTLTRPSIDRQTLLAAVASYLMLGMFFAFAYRAVAATQSAPFFGSAGTGKVSDDLFFSFVTLTTTGYGNLVPAGNPGQTMAVTEAIVGQLFLVTAVAKIVNESGILTSRLGKGRRHLDDG